MPEAHGKAYEIFKKTREERGLSLSEVANALHLTVTMIEQIEAGEFTHRHLAPVFMRGYIRSYAKYLNLPENLVDEMVSPLIIENPIKAAEESKPSYVKQDKKRPSVLNSKKILSYLLVVALLIIIASVWHETNKPKVTSQPEPIVEQTENTILATEPESEPMDEDTATVPSPSESDVPLESENDAPLNSEEETPLVPEEESAPETTPSAPVVETPPAAPAVVTPPPPVKKAPAPPKITTPTPTAPTSPEVVDAQETP